MIRSHEDWISVTAVGNTNFTTTTSGTASTSIIVPNNSTALGVVQLSVSNGAICNLNSGVRNILLGHGVITLSFRVYIPVLSTSSQEYVLRLGLGDTTTSGDFADGVYFEYNRTQDTHWLIKTASSGSITATPTSISVPVTTWTTLEIEISDSGSSADFFIDNINVGNIQNNMPTTEIGILYKIEKTNGSTARTFALDYSIFEWDPSI